MEDKKTLAPLTIEIKTYDKLLKIMAKYSNEKTKIISVREAIEKIINEKYKQISGSIRW